MNDPAAWGLLSGFLLVVLGVAQWAAGMFRDDDQ